MEWDPFALETDRETLFHNIKTFVSSDEYFSFARYVTDTDEYVCEFDHNFSREINFCEKLVFLLKKRYFIIAGLLGRVGRPKPFEVRENSRANMKKNDVESRKIFCRDRKEHFKCMIHWLKLKLGHLTREQDRHKPFFS